MIRFNGGPQAGHNVVAPNGRHHTFAQFGSETLAGARTYLSEHMLLSPLAMPREAEDLAQQGIPDAFGLMMIDERATVITLS